MSGDLPPGVPVEGPDGHLHSEVGGFRPVPARIRGVIYFKIWIWPSSAAKPGLLLHVTQYCFRAGNRSSGPDFRETAIGKTPKSVLRPAEGRAESRFRFFPGSSPAKIRPGSPIYGPEALLRNIEYPVGKITAVRVQPSDLMWCTALDSLADVVGRCRGSRPKIHLKIVSKSLNALLAAS